jgi:hypothetical protein
MIQGIPFLQCFVKIINAFQELKIRNADSMEAWGEEFLVLKHENGNK